MNCPYPGCDAEIDVPIFSTPGRGLYCEECLEEIRLALVSGQVVLQAVDDVDEDDPREDALTATERNPMINEGHQGRGW